MSGMKYLLPCKCGQSVEIEPGQAGQNVVCSCGENLLVPTMLQVKALPVAPEKQIVPEQKTDTTVRTYGATLILFVLGITCVSAAYFLWWYGYRIPYSSFVFAVCLGLGLALIATSPVTVLRIWLRKNDTNILSRSFFIIGIALFFPAFILAVYLYLWTPNPLHATVKRTQFSYGSNQKMLHQDSTSIPYEELAILWVTDEKIDQMTPINLFLFFKTLEEPTFSNNFRDNYEAVWATYRIWIVVNVVLFILVFSSIVTSFFMPKRCVVVTGWSGSEWQ